MKHHKTIFFIGLIIILAIFSLPQDIVEEMTIKGYLYSVVSPSKNIDIITDHQIRDLGIINISELFNLISSITVSRRGPFDSSFDFSMRGSNFEQVLILINGIPFNNPQTGHFNSDLPFSLQDVKRIEVLKGGNATNYGSGALAGAINIILKKSENISFSLTGGENSHLGTRLAMGKTLGKLSFRASVRKNKNNGFYMDREMDNLNLNSSIHFQSSKTVIDLYGGLTHKDFGALGFYAPYPAEEKTKSNFIQFHISHQLKNFRLNIKASFSNHDDDFTLDRYNPEFYHNTSHTYERLFNFSTIYKGKLIRVASGIEYKDQKLDSSTMKVHSREIPALFFNIFLPINNQKGGLDLSSRVIFLKGQNPNFTFFSGIHYNFSGQFSLKCSISKTIRFPSFTELFYNSPANLGDQFLRPEKSLNIEGVLAWILTNQSISLSLFYRDQQNLIDWIKTANHLPWEAKNISNHNIFGFEITHNLFLQKLNIITSCEKLFTDHTNLPFLSKYGLRFPDFMLKTNIVYPLTKKIKWSCSYCYKNILNSSEHGHFLNTTFTYRISDKLGIKLNVDNLFNTKIEEIPGVPTSGRWLYISILYN